MQTALAWPSNHIQCPLFSLSIDQSTFSFSQDNIVTCEVEQDLHLTDSRNVSLVLSTPAVQGLSLQDFNLAIRIDESDVQYSPKWIKENPHLWASSQHLGESASSSISG